MTTLEQDVAQWPATVPHEDWCPSLIVLHTYGSGACICDREQRIAARVADAIRAATAYVHADYLTDARSAALRMLTQEKP